MPFPNIEGGKGVIGDKVDWYLACETQKTGQRRENMKKAKLLGPLLILVILTVTVFAPCAPASAEERHIMMPSMPRGLHAYVTVFGISEIINKKSKWLRATAVESSGTSENARLVEDRPKEVLAFGNPVMLYPAKIGQRPAWDHPMPMKVICQLVAAGIVPATLNPDIKSIADCKGKTIMIWLKGGEYELLWDGWLSAHGMSLDDVKLVYGSATKACDSLKDGRIDIGMLGLVAPEVGVMPPNWTQLMVERDVRYVQLTDKDFEAARAKYGYPWYLGIMPKATNRGFTSDVWYRKSVNLMMCHPDMDDQVVTEFLTIMFENYKDLVRYHKANAAMSPEKFTDCGVAKEDFHPAAIKFYEKHGISFPDYAPWGKRPGK